MLSGTRLRSLWTPKGISPALWVDASDYSTFSFESGTSRITEWRDKSGNNRHLSQSTSAQRPIYVPNGLNGFPSVYFDGNDFLKHTGTYTRTAATLFVVFNQTISATSALVNIRREGAIFELVTTPLVGYTNISFTATIVAGNPTPIAMQAQGINAVLGSQGTIMCVQYNGIGIAATDYLVNFNGSNVNVTNSGVLGYTSETGFSIGVRPIQNIIYYTGHISEILYFESQLNINTVNKIAGALAYKRRLTGVLPSGHLFKNYPPRGV